MKPNIEGNTAGKKAFLPCTLGGKISQCSELMQPEFQTDWAQAHLGLENVQCAVGKTLSRTGYLQYKSVHKVCKKTGW